MASITPRKGKNGEIVSYRIRVSRDLIVFAEDFEWQCAFLGEANSGMRLGDFCSQYLEIAKNTLSPTTYEFYKLKNESLIIPALGHLKLKDITPAHIKQFVNRLAAVPKEKRSGLPDEQVETLSPPTVQRYLTILQSIFKQAVKLGLILKIPQRSSGLHIQRLKRRKLTYLPSKRRRKCLPLSKKKIYNLKHLFSLPSLRERGAGSLRH